jgi:hypothetical protein
MEAKEDDPSTGRVLVAEFHYVTTRFRLARVFETYELFISLNFQFFGGRG